MAVSRTHTIQGVAVPAFFYGTAWKEDRTAALTRAALDAGFRAIDTANQRKHYHEAGVGEAVAAAIAGGVVSRDELFLQTKFTYARGQDHRLPYDPSADVATQVRQSFESSLVHLQTPRIDAYVLHGPSGGVGWSETDAAVWRAMEALHDAGRVRLLGVSNVALAQLEALWIAARVKPAFVQNRCYARTGWDRDVRLYCRDRGVGYQGFSLLTANGRELATKPVLAIARRVGRTLPQVVFRFAMQVGMIPLTGTTSGEHMREDLASFDFELSDEDVRAIERVGG